MEAIRALRLPEAPPEGYVDEMLRLMRAHGVTAYDAAYHALARVRRGVMVTADRRYVQRAASAGHVMALAEWRS
jgi:predicted nucleic acid-binding protein